MEKLNEWVILLLTRWTAKSPRTYRIITNVCTVIGIIASIVSILPTFLPNIILPPWTIALTAFLIAVAAKFTVSKSPPDA